MLPTIVENNNDTVIGIRNGIFGVTHILVLPAASSWLICSSVESSDIDEYRHLQRTILDVFHRPNKLLLALGSSIM